MVNNLLVFDEEEVLLGYFFKTCHKDLDIFFEGNNINTDIIYRGDFSMIISIKTNELRNIPFVFSVFTHGDSNSLLQNAQNSYISTSSDLSVFENSFVYAYACQSGIILGQELINKGCKCFIGYNKTIHIWSNFISPFVNTATYGLKLFYEGRILNEIFQGIKEKYNEEIDKLYNKDYVIASILMENRDALVIYGDKNLDISDFETE